jgi:hypothetical protein
VAPLARALGLEVVRLRAARGEGDRGHRGGLGDGGGGPGGEHDGGVAGGGGDAEHDAQHVHQTVLRTQDDLGAARSLAVGVDDVVVLALGVEDGGVHVSLR